MPFSCSYCYIVLNITFLQKVHFLCLSEKKNYDLAFERKCYYQSELNRIFFTLGMIAGMTAEMTVAMTGGMTAEMTAGMTIVSVMTAEMTAGMIGKGHRGHLGKKNQGLLKDPHLIMMTHSGIPNGKEWKCRKKLTQW